MGKSNAVSKRRRKSKNPRFVHKSKLKKQRNKILKKSTKIECEPIRKLWNSKKNMATNLLSMGLTLNPNAILKTKPESSGKSKKDDKSKDKTKVIKDLQAIADRPAPKNFRFGPQTIKFCVYMIEKYGDDYKAMARDKQNYYQESSGQIRQKINKFKSIPSNWNSYLKAKECVQTSNDII